MLSTRNRTTSESADAVGLIIALLVRFPQVATLTSHPGERTLTLSFAIDRRLDRTTQRDLREAILEHVRAFSGLAGEAFDTLEVACEADERMSFVRVTRDARHRIRAIRTVSDRSIRSRARWSTTHRSPRPGSSPAARWSRSSCLGTAISDVKAEPPKARRSMVVTA